MKMAIMVMSDDDNDGDDDDSNDDNNDDDDNGLQVVQQKMNREVARTISGDFDSKEQVGSWSRG